MNRTLYFVRDYYNKQVVRRIMEKYEMHAMDAARSFLESKTHALLEDADCGLDEFPELAIFDLWETEMKTGDPRNSAYVKGE